MKIHPISALSDNYIWIIEHLGNAIIVDPGESAPVLAFLEAQQLAASAILITHHHDDHTGGVGALKARYPAIKIYAHHSHNVPCDVAVDEGDALEIDGLSFDVWRTAGHTDTHLSYLCHIQDKTHVFCGDTLFSGGCGRVFTGTMSQLFASLARFCGLADDTLFYPAHEYTLSNLKFCQYIEPDNQDTADKFNEVQQLISKGTPSLPVSLADEKRVNVFLRCNQPNIKNRLMKLELIGDNTDDFLVFQTLRELKNTF